MDKLVIGSSIVLTITILICLYRAVKGPSVADRLIAINVIGTKTVVLIIIISFILKENFFIDVAIVYSLISFLASIAIANYIKVKK